MAPTYVFKHGKVYTVVGGKVVAAVEETDFEEVKIGKCKGCDCDCDEDYCPDCKKKEASDSSDDSDNSFPFNFDKDEDKDGDDDSDEGHSKKDKDKKEEDKDEDEDKEDDHGDDEEAKESKVARPVEQFVEPVDNMEEADEDLDMPEPPDDLQEDLLSDIKECDACGEPCEDDDSFCSKCGEPLSDSVVKDEEELGIGHHHNDEFGFEKDDAEDFMMSARPIAKVTTPNGLEGKVMNKVAGLWGDEVTVRFDNGRIKRMPVTSDMKFTKIEEEAPESPVEDLRIRLNASVEGDLSSLRIRKEDLQTIQVQASSLIQETKSYEEAKELDQIALEASFEEKEIDSAIEHYMDAKNEAFIPTAPFKSSAVEQANLGGGDGGWLAEVVSSMNESARATDYSKLMNEGPISFVVEADDATIANAGATRIAATRFVRQFTSAAAATTTEAQRAQYERQFLTRVEDARKQELSSRKAATRKEASKAVEAATDAPDDALFF